MTVETLTLVQGKDKLELPQQNGNWVLATHRFRCL